MTRDDVHMVLGLSLEAIETRRTSDDDEDREVLDLHIASHNAVCDAFDFPLSKAEPYDPDAEEVREEPNDCPECARSFGPRYTGRCPH